MLCYRGAPFFLATMTFSGRPPFPSTMWKKQEEQQQKQNKQKNNYILLQAHQLIPMGHLYRKQKLGNGQGVKPLCIAAK